MSNQHQHKKQRLNPEQSTPTNTTTTTKKIVIDDQDIHFEENVINNPFKIQPWLQYISMKKRNREHLSCLFRLYERSVLQLPGSYKLWYEYLQLRIVCAKRKKLDDAQLGETNACFERCLKFMYKMPVIWLEYARFLSYQGWITKTRNVFDRALKNLPVTQHEKIWKEYLKWINMEHIPLETARHVYERYLQLKPEKILDYIDLLIKRGDQFNACVEYELLLKEDGLENRLPVSKYEIWNKMCELIEKYPHKLQSFNVEQVLRDGIENYKTETGKIWVAMAKFFIARGDFNKARKIFEESLDTIKTVVDFTIVYNAYAKFEEQIVQHLMTQKDEEDDDEEEDDDDDEEEGEDIEGNNEKEKEGEGDEEKEEEGGNNNEEEEEGEDEDDEDDEEDDEQNLIYAMKRWESLLDRRPLILNTIKLKQNPHNVHEWIKRTMIFKDGNNIVKTFSKAIETIDYKKASGKLSTLWVNFAKFYEFEYSDFEKSRIIFNKGLEKEFRHTSDYITLWSEFAEFELRNGFVLKAIEVLKRALQIPGKKDLESVRYWIHRNINLWSFLIDLMESQGDLEKTKKYYDLIFNKKIITPQLALSYAQLLWDNDYFEDSFKVYERSTQVFYYPALINIWIPYLLKFIERYKGNNIERTRDLFENCLEKIPKKFSKKIFLLYSKFEENFGRVKLSLEILDRALEYIPDEEKEELFYIYVNTASQYYSISKIRKLFQNAITNTLPKESLKNVFLKFINLEIKLGEIDRARSLYANGGEYGDENYFLQYEEFEKIYGNLETFKEMFRLKEKVLK